MNELHRKETEEFRKDPIGHAKKRYIAQSGLMHLDPHEPVGTDADNDNGILYLAVFVQRLIDKGIDIEPLREVSKRAIESTFVYDKEGKRIEGLFHRKHTAGAESANPHDNYNGTCYLSMVFDLPYAREICIKGMETHWVLDNQDPDNPNLSRIKTPSETGYYMFLAGFKPSAIEAIWYVGATLITLGYAMAPRSSCHQLSYLRTNAIEMAWKKYGEPRKYWLWIYSACNAVWRISAAVQGGTNRIFSTFYNWERHGRPNQTHPNRMCSYLDTLPDASHSHQKT